MIRLSEKVGNSICSSYQELFRNNKRATIRESEESAIPMPELTAAVKKAVQDRTEVDEVMQYCRANMEILIKDSELQNVAALKVAMKRLAGKYGCQAIAIQCWNQLQSELGIMPCAANALLNDEGIPVVCDSLLLGNARGIDEPKGMGTYLWVEVDNIKRLEAKLVEGSYIHLR